MKAKRVIKHICTLPSIFFKLSKKDNNFDKLRSTLLSKITDDHPLLKELIIPHNDTIKYIIDLRNYREHPNEKKMTIINNFRLTPDTEIVVPQWYVSGNEPHSIKEDMQRIVIYLLEVAEERYQVHFLLTKLNLVYVLRLKFSRNPMFS